MKWGHDQLARDLAEHLRYTGARMVWEDMQMGPSGSARPDVYTMNKSFRSPRPITYEVKISVADFRSDVTSGKWQKYLDFSCGVIFAVPKGLIKKDDIPPGCGLIIRGDKAWRTAKGPTLGMVTLNQNHLLKLLIDGVRRLHRPIEPRGVDGAWCQNALERRGLGRDVAAAVQDLRRVKERVEQARADGDQIITEAKEQAAALRAGEDTAVRDLHVKLCATLGIDPNGFRLNLPQLVKDFENYIESLRYNLTADAEVLRLQAIIDQISKSVQRASDLPKPSAYWRPPS